LSFAKYFIIDFALFFSKTMSVLKAKKDVKTTDPKYNQYIIFSSNSCNCGLYLNREIALTIIILVSTTALIVGLLYIYTSNERCRSKCQDSCNYRGSQD